MNLLRMTRADGVTFDARVGTEGIENAAELAGWSQGHPVFLALPAGMDPAAALAIPVARPKTPAELGTLPPHLRRPRKVENTA